MTRLVQRFVIPPRHLPVPLRRYHRRHPTLPRRRQHSVGVITPIRQQMRRRNAVNQRLGLGTVRHRSRRDPQIDRYPVGIYRQMQFGVGAPL